MIKLHTATQILADEQIIERIINGENDLYERIIRKYNDRLFRISMSIINDEAEAKDIMQTTYLNAFLKLHVLKNRSGFGTWLTSVMLIVN
jgi:RNA polymerase sigma-70 factor (ECF subfamily)